MIHQTASRLKIAKGCTHIASSFTLQHGLTARKDVYIKFCKSANKQFWKGDLAKQGCWQLYMRSLDGSFAPRPEWSLAVHKFSQFVFWKYIIKGNLSGYFGFNNEQLNEFSGWPSYNKKQKTIFSIIGCILNYMTKQLCGLMVVITPKTIHIVKRSIIVTILKILCAYGR